MLSLLFFVACFETSHPEEPINPIGTGPDPIEEGSCLESSSSFGWEEVAPEGLSMAAFMENIPESFTTSVVLNEQYEHPTCLNVSLVPDASTLAYVTSEYVPPTSEDGISNGMMPLCMNHFKVDATLSLFTPDGELEEHADIELRLNFEEDGSVFMMDFHTDIDRVEGAVGNILNGQEIEGIYLGGGISEDEFHGGLYATTIEQDDEIVIATRYALAQWDGSPQLECE